MLADSPLIRSEMKMAGMGRRGLKLSQIKPQEAYSEAAIRTNNAILEFCRTSFSGLSGATAGVLGLTALYGFIFYFVASLFMSLLLILKAGSSWGRYFKSRWRIFTSGLMGGLFTYVLSWTFVYGMVHVY